MLHERIRAHLDRSRPLDSAILLAVYETVAVANTRLLQGEQPDTVLENLYLTDVPDIRQHLHPTRLRKFGALLSFGPLQIVMPGDDIQGIPSPSCIARHLPTDRPPTADEIRRAWQQCTA